MRTLLWSAEEEAGEATKSGATEMCHIHWTSSLVLLHQQKEKEMMEQQGELNMIDRERRAEQRRIIFKEKINFREKEKTNIFNCTSIFMFTILV